MARSIGRVIELLKTVNATAIDNDDGKPGEFLATLCREAARLLAEHSLTHVAGSTLPVCCWQPAASCFDVRCDVCPNRTLIYPKPRRDGHPAFIDNFGDHGC